MSQRFEAEQWIAAPLPRVFAFFADPHNLPRIMPPRQGATLVTLKLLPPRCPADLALMDVCIQHINWPPPHHMSL